MPKEDLIEATVLCDNSVLDSLVEDFGTDIKVSLAGDEQFTAILQAGDNLYYWIKAYDDEAKIIGPEAVIEDYRKFCEDEMEGIY